MKITETETLYSKKGRRYVPTYSLAHWNYEGDMMPVGSFRLVHAYSDGGRRYAYEVTPDTAGWVAAATLAVHAMTEAIHKANQHTIASGKPWTKKQQAAIAQANSILEAAGIWSGRGWTTAQAYDVVQAGIDAVKQWANQPKDEMTEAQMGRWYMVNRDCMATLCADREDADAQSVWPHMGPHRAVQLAPAGDMAKLRGQRAVLCSLLRECMPVIDALMQMPGDDDSDARLNGLAGRIMGALNALAEDQVKGGES